MLRENIAKVLNAFYTLTKVNLSLCLIKHAMKINWGNGGSVPPFLTSTLDGV
jgi:hypothetical protein